jgi:ADP-dependent phosphofructokinase/glucokinase
MSKLEEIINEYKKTRVETKRVHYPRGMELDEEFVKALQSQISQLRNGENPMTNKQIVDKMQRAIPFYVYDSK